MKSHQEGLHGNPKEKKGKLKMKPGYEPPGVCGSLRGQANWKTRGCWSNEPGLEVPASVGLLGSGVPGSAEKPTKKPGLWNQMCHRWNQLGRRRDVFGHFGVSTWLCMGVPCFKGTLFLFGVGTDIDLLGLAPRVTHA